ncbi:MAG: T9SS type A sorting domain-containing protein, partial [Anaerolineales bacterium]|nr:T9SS type A sorting domain-containing protein [Anaerolineales bacterium]
DPPAVFMNERDIAMYADDEAYPLLNLSNNIEEDPQLVDTDMRAEIDAGYAKYGSELCDSFIPGNPAFEGYLHHYPGGDGVQDVFFFVEWPLAENLAYTNSTLLAHSTTGGPIGDPRWYSEGGTGVNSSTLPEATMSNYPNPFTGSTTISYSIRNESDVKLSVFDISGREVTVLVDQNQSGGTYQVDWNGASDAGLAMPGGIYFYQIRRGNSIETQKMLLVR